MSAGLYGLTESDAEDVDRLCGYEANAVQFGSADFPRRSSRKAMQTFTHSSRLSTVAQCTRCMRSMTSFLFLSFLLSLELFAAAAAASLAWAAASALASLAACVFDLAVSLALFAEDPAPDLSLLLPPVVPPPPSLALEPDLDLLPDAFPDPEACPDLVGGWGTGWYSFIGGPGCM